MVVIGSLSPRFLTPTSLADVWAGIHVTAEGSMPASSMLSNNTLNTLAKGRLAEQAQARPAAMASTQGLQSLKERQPGRANAVAWRMAQASAPGMSVTYRGGDPRAAATTRPASSSTTKDQPRRRVSGWPSWILDPSVYTVPQNDLSRPSGSSIQRTHVNVPCTGEHSCGCSGSRGTGNRPELKAH